MTPPNFNSNKHRHYNSNRRNISTRRGNMRPSGDDILDILIDAGIKILEALSSRR